MAEESMAAIAEMIAVELGASPEEVERWKEFVHRLDVAKFEETGEVVLRGPSDLESDAISTDKTEPGQYDPDEIRRVLNKMRAGVRDRMPERRRTPLKRLRNMAGQPAEPDYNSVETDLWLYGPFS